MYEKLARLIALGLYMKSMFSIFLKQGLYDPRILNHIETYFRNTAKAIEYLYTINDALMLHKYLQAGYKVNLTQSMVLFCDKNGSLKVGKM